MISKEQLKSLIEREAKPEAHVLSVYLDTDQSRQINIERAFEVVLRDMLRDVMQQVGDDQKPEFNENAQRVQDFVEKYREPKRGLTIFSDASDDFLWTGELNVGVRNAVLWRDVPNTRPLIELMDEYERYGVILSDREHARLFTVYMGEIEEQRELFAEANVTHVQSPGTDHAFSQMQIERKADEHAHWHLKNVADMMSRLSNYHEFDRLILAVPLEITSELSNLLPVRLRMRVARQISLPVQASDALVLEETMRVEQEIERERETELVNELITAAGKHDKAVLNLGPTVRAIQEWRVWQLVYADGFAASGSQCGNCGALFTLEEKVSCDFCGQAVHKVDDLVERASSRVLQMSGRVEQVRGDAATRLQEVGNIGARLRW